MRRPTARRRRRAAFTLMEVLLVVAILLILGSIVVVSFTGIFAGAEEDSTKAQLDQVATAVKLFKFQCRRAPAGARVTGSRARYADTPAAPPPGAPA